MTAVITDEKIPNNVNLAGDRRLQRALEEWQPHFLSWWQDMGPVGFQAKDVYLRTAVSVEADGWAHFDYVKMPDYRWGIFLEPKQAGRVHGFGDNQGQPVWDEVPGEFRNMLRRLVVTQGDTEPASVEQQRHLGSTAPSLYDLRNLFQVNVEEGRHLWAMVYLLHKYFGKDGREEAEALLERRSGDADRPRILGAFNEKTPDWLSFFFFTFLTDRDGKPIRAGLTGDGHLRRVDVVVGAGRSQEASAGDGEHAGCVVPDRARDRRHARAGFRRGGAGRTQIPCDESYWRTCTNRLVETAP